MAAFGGCESSDRSEIFFQQARVQHTWREEIDFSFENYKII